MSAISTRSLEKHLRQHGLVPDHCRLIEVSIAPNSALVIRYEVFVEAQQMAAFAEAMADAAHELAADDERNRAALSSLKAKNA